MAQQPSYYSASILYLASMFAIKPVAAADTDVFINLVVKTFRETHQAGVPAAALEYYIANKLAADVLKQELEDSANIFHFIYTDDELAGYSKIILNKPFASIASSSVTKLERLYLLQQFHSQKLGAKLFVFNTDLAKKNNQDGIWLYVWKANEKAISFYTKAGFTIVGSGDFKISETHSNPNHIMYCKF